MAADVGHDLAVDVELMLVQSIDEATGNNLAIGPGYAKLQLVALSVEGQRLPVRCLVTDQPDGFARCPGAG